LAWYEQPAVSTGSWVEHIISATTVAPISLDVVDMDRDGDLDVVIGEHNLTNPTNARTLVFENQDGNGGQWRSHLVHTGDEHHNGAQVTDIDADGDSDIVSIGWGHSNVIVYENKAGTCGGQSTPTPTVQPEPGTPTSTPTATPTATDTPTATATVVVTATATLLPTVTPTASSTATVTAPVETATVTPTATVTLDLLPTATPTDVTGGSSPAPIFLPLILDGN